MHTRNSNNALNCHTDQTYWDRRSSCSGQNLNLNLDNQPPQFYQQEVFRSPEMFHWAQQIQQTQQDGFIYGYTPAEQMRWVSSQQVNTVGLQDSSRRYSCSVQNLVSNIPGNQFGSQTKLNNPKHNHVPRNITMVQQGRNVKNGPLAGLVHGKFLSAQHLNLVGQRETVAPSPMKNILGTDKMLVIWHGRPDIRLLRDKNSGSPYCIAQFINEMEAEKIRLFWNGTEIVKGQGKLIVEYFNDY
ncbi:unnamed protein product, partial [Mesorhabditis belari]|uniref:Uncharacterized protein n=1 Tax=Mesorhabditis belari TaxID=2138241 RepID=A0AAF3FJ28_9BILA